MNNPHIQRWVHPGYYIGKEWPGWYSVIGHCRDSNTLEESNYYTTKALLAHLNTEANINDEVIDTITENRCHHWLVGWCEDIMIHESNIDALRMAEGIMKGLEDYPILDDYDYTARENEVIQEAWKWMDIRDRVKAIKEYSRENTSVFAARRDYCPPDCGIEEYLRQP